MPTYSANFVKVSSSLGQYMVSNFQKVDRLPSNIRRDSWGSYSGAPKTNPNGTFTVDWVLRGPKGGKKALVSGALIYQNNKGPACMFLDVLSYDLQKSDVFYLGNQEAKEDLRPDILDSAARAFSQALKKTLPKWTIEVQGMGRSIRATSGDGSELWIRVYYTQAGVCCDFNSVFIKEKGQRKGTFSKIVNVARNLENFHEIRITSVSTEAIKEWGTKQGMIWDESSLTFSEVL